MGTGHVSTFIGLAHGDWVAPTFDQLASRGFEQNPVVHRSVRMITDAVGAIPWLTYVDGDRRDDHALDDLVRRPNATQSGPELVEALVSHLMVSGDAYLQVVLVDGLPKGLQVLRPDRMRILEGWDGWPSGFEYTVGGEKTHFPAEAGPGSVPQVLHVRLNNPRDDHHGLSPLAAAGLALDIHNAASTWSKALLENSARPSGALVYASERGNLTTEQFGRLKDELHENFEGAANAGRPLLLEGGLDWKAIGYSPRDLDFNETKNVAAREIALAFGVPPMLLGLPGDNTYSNYREANRAFYRQTVLPLSRRIAAALAHWLNPLWPEDLRLEPDVETLDALQPEREALWRRTLAATVLSTNEKRAALGYGAVDGGDTIPALGEPASE